jgi:hypothetical protein
VACTGADAMQTNDDERGNEAPRRGSTFIAFWSSLPGILTGVAALITAIATLAALNVGDGGSGQTSAGRPAPSQPTASPRPSGDGCFGRYFAGIPSDRIAPVETGTADFDVITADQPKAGTIGLKFTNSNDPLGAMRIAFFPANSLFKIESIVDDRCTRIGDYSNVARGGDRNVLQNSDTVRFRIDGRYYDLRIGASTTIRLNFEAYVP